MVNNLLQALGVVLVLVWCWLVWPPLPLLVGGLLLVVAAEVRERASPVGAGSGGESG